MSLSTAAAAEEEEKEEEEEEEEEGGDDVAERETSKKACHTLGERGGGATPLFPVVEFVVAETRDSQKAKSSEGLSLKRERNDSGLLSVRRGGG